ncbi:MAG: LON peptidase substrate-binding domain-containing protein [Paracoccus sp. (in: a-proteobacteria)]|jgi:Lon protease-like protein|uniref:LON peptidase substrate-binding domain-containing protein n=1 Tax=unclassified Paracoccus (in: a-proteobacteria) TaxID=2688777 RepID=UPI000C517BF7|nr:MULTISPECIES: LON peptidase substrate-binding domain-containing protein [unclassified Paracoccus (in: a-proteobacteria)]MAN57577.1 ATP-dependent protease [Paracoccus sp. (in: a-proteobacteria)]MBA49057.1 ATP-dependent protease [Paracoccus sp. (in: a-proteobacteria)]MDB2552336.1 LON peptidase substrate-binding domain-containing protein [Paracoccus sp. (in: a-proteobacteria)]|tara:strand:+ start:6794 stop:7423 length:630 start_codon:yes stop_codon:yes gene_type:complete
MGFRFDLPPRIPLFPLPGAVLMPRAKLPLHIFEPRYLQMMEDVLKTDHRLIGMVQPEGDGLATIGCAGRVIAFSESDDGRLMISLKAVSRFRLADIEEGFAPYLQAHIDWTGFDRDLKGPERDPGLDRERLFPLLQRFLSQHELSTDWGAAQEAEDEMLVNSLSMMLPFSNSDKQALLESPTLADRRELLQGLIEFALHGGGDTEERLQ